MAACSKLVGEEGVHPYLPKAGMLGSASELLSCSPEYELEGSFLFVSLVGSLDLMEGDTSRGSKLSTRIWNDRVVFYLSLNVNFFI